MSSTRLSTRSGLPSRPNTLPRELVPGVSVAAVIGAGAARLAAAGWPDARHQAGRLWAGLQRRSLGVVWLEQDMTVPGEQRARYARAIERRVAGEPLPYVTGWAGFRTLDLAVDARVLIPRPETEGLVDLVIQRMRAQFGRDSWGVAADIGTGSGCIALSLAVEGVFQRIVATDVSPDALTVARANVARVAPRTPVELRCGDLLAPLRGERFRVIVANPPYVAQSEVDGLPDSVQRYEPLGALVSDDEGLRHTRDLLEAAGDALRDGGLLAVEIDSRRANRVLAIAERVGWTTGGIHRDVFGRRRYLLTTKE